MATQSQETANDRLRTRPHRSAKTDTRTVFDRLKQAIPVALGMMLVIRGLRRRSLRGIATALVGGWMVNRTIGGTDGIRQTLQSRTGLGARMGRQAEATDTPSVSRSITIGKPVDELYEAWRDPDQLSQIMGHFAEVTAEDDDRLRWTIHGPRGRDVSWETRIVEEEPGQSFRWETPEYTILPHEGSVYFRPAWGDRGTVVTLSVSFEPPAGVLGDMTLRQLGIVPDTLVGTALRRFKSLAESGEIQTLERNPSARGKGDLL